MVDMVRYGSLDPFPFKLTKDGAGVDLVIDGGTPATALNDGDLWLFTRTTAGVVSTRQIDVSAEVTKEDATNMPGCYFWTPASVADTQVNFFTINVRDADAGGAFDENSVNGYTHGDLNARFNGS